MCSGNNIPELPSFYPVLLHAVVLPQKPVPRTEFGVSQSQREQNEILICKYHWTTLKWSHFWLCLKHHLKG